jgi:hypothetical protein
MQKKAVTVEVVAENYRRRIIVRAIFNYYIKTIIRNINVEKLRS